MRACAVALPAVVGGVLKAIWVDGDEHVHTHGVEQVGDARGDVILCDEPLYEVQEDLPARHLGGESVGKCCRKITGKVPYIGCL